MSNLVITYDLYKQGQNFDELIKKIKELGNWAKIGLSCWYVSSNLSAADARKSLVEVMDKNDRLFIVNASNNSCSWENLPKEVEDYIREHWNK